MTVLLALLGVGLALLLAGGEALVRGATALAKALGVAPVLIGLTVVAFGTSTPELVVNAAAALRGETGVAFGNVVGSNIANIGLILGLSALVAPLMIHRSLARRDIPLAAASAVLALVLALVTLVPPGLSIGERVPGPSLAPPGFGRGEGIILLAGFLFFLLLSLRGARRRTGPGGRGDVAPGPSSAGAGATGGPGSPTDLRPLGLVLAGLTGLILGAEMTVRAAVEIADVFGVPQAVIGLSVVAVGTSLPELATSVTAARRGAGDLAVGNVVGSNLYNLLFVWGISVLVAPGPLPSGGLVDLGVMVGFSLLLLIAAQGPRPLGRVWGGGLLLAYVLYLALRFSG